MKEIVDAILLKYGLWALSLAFLLIWGLAHWTASPGTPVSILWGLVEYTKSTTQIDSPDTKKEYSDRTSSIPNTAHEIMPVMMDERIYLNNRPKELIDSIANLTSMQAEVFTKQNYYGKWIRVRGPVHDVRGDSEQAYLHFEIDGIFTLLQMKKEYTSRVSHFRKGDVITVDGMFNEITNSGRVIFREGEVVATE